MSSFCIESSLIFFGAQKATNVHNCWEPPGLAQRAPGPFGPGTPNESERVFSGLRHWGAPESPKIAPRSLKRVQKKSELALLDSFRTPGHTLSRGRRPWDTLSDSFRTLLGFRVRRAREAGALCARPGGSQHNRRRLRTNCREGPQVPVLPEDYCKEDPCNFPWERELAMN